MKSDVETVLHADAVWNVVQVVKKLSRCNIGERKLPRAAKILSSSVSKCSSDIHCLDDVLLHVVDQRPTDAHLWKHSRRAFSSGSIVVTRNGAARETHARGWEQVIGLVECSRDHWHVVVVRAWWRSEERRVG